MRIPNKLLVEESEFPRGNSTTDIIQALSVVVERRRQFRMRMLPDHVDLKKGFDSLHRKALWDLLRLRRIPPWTVY